MLFRMTGIEQLLSTARAYGQAAGVEPTAVSWRVFGDSKKLDAIATKGADIQLRRFEAAMQWFSTNWPEGAAWPAGVQRPAGAEANADAQRFDRDPAARLEATVDEARAVPVDAAA